MPIGKATAKQAEIIPTHLKIIYPPSFLYKHLPLSAPDYIKKKKNRFLKAKIGNFISIFAHNRKRIDCANHTHDDNNFLLCLNLVAHLILADKSPHLTHTHTFYAHHTL